MISVEEHERIQVLLSRPQSPFQNQFQNYYSGIIKCGHCQSAITGYSKTKNNKHKGLCIYHYLKCTKKKELYCSQKPLTRDELDNQILEALKCLVIPEKIVDFIIMNIEEVLQKEQSKSTKVLGQLKKELNKLDGELETLGRKLISGVMDDEMYPKLKQKIKTEQKIIAKKMIRYNKNNSKELEKLRGMFRFLDFAPGKFISGTYELKKLILQTIGSNFTLNNGKISIELSKGFSLLQKVKNQFNIKNQWIEPKHTRTTKGLKSVEDPKYTVWSSWWDEIRTFLYNGSNLNNSTWNAGRSDKNKKVSWVEPLLV